MGFLYMKPPFDIAGDLDTPVSAFAKLAPFEPRFLLESVEGGERIGRYSFIGFGDALQVRLDEQSFQLGERAAPGTAHARRSCSMDCAQRCGGCRCRLPALGQVPLAGGLVGFTSYDVVRFFERLPQRRARALPGVPLLHYVAPRSLLVFDHVSRGIALLHAGSDPNVTRCAAKSSARCAVAVPRIVRAGSVSGADAGADAREYMAGVRRAQEYIAAGDVYQLVLASRFSGRHALDPFQVYRALRLINPSPYMYFCRLGDLTVVGSSPEALVKLNGGQAELRPIAGTQPARRRPGRRSEAGSRTARRRQGKCRACDAGGSGAQRSGPRRLRRQRAGRTLSLDRALQSRDAHRQRRARHSSRRSATHSTCSPPHFRPARWSVRPRCAPWRSSRNSNRCGADCMAVRWATSARRARWIRRSRSRTLVFHGDEYSYQAGAGIVADSQPAVEHDEVLAKSAALLAGRCSSRRRGCERAPAADR